MDRPIAEPDRENHAVLRKDLCRLKGVFFYASVQTHSRCRGLLCQLIRGVLTRKRRRFVGKLEFKSQRITREYRQTINSTPGKVFPLLCPVREADWLDGWRFNMIYSESGVVEEGAVFNTPYDGEADTVWIVTKHDSKSHEVDFARFTHNSRTCILKIAVKHKDEISSYVDVSYTYTGITPAGNDFIKNFTEEAFLEAVTFWEKSMNFFLETGERLKKDS